MWIKTLALVLGFLGLTTSLTSAADSLPWEKDYGTALAKANAEKRPIFLMLTATWCGPCKMLEQHTLVDPDIREAMKEFVMVKGYEVKALNEKFHLSGYPTLVFIDSSNEKVLTQSCGYENPGSFMWHLIEARKAAGLPLSPKMKAMIAQRFVPDESKLESLLTSGDVKGLVKYLGTADKDTFRENNFLVLKFNLPSGIKISDLKVTVFAPRQLSDSGVLLVPVDRNATNVDVKVLVPGIMSFQRTLVLDTNRVASSQEIVLTKLTPADAAIFTGRVLQPDGNPATNAIVRICDWDTTRTDGEGQFVFNNVAPGKLTVRAEYSSGEFQEELEFSAGQELKKDLTLTAVTTVGIRWALQTKEGSRELTGEGVKTGEAWFSIKHGRFLLSRGTEVPEWNGSDFMLADAIGEMGKYMKPEKLAALQAAPAGTPFFWLFDACSRPTGLHLENAPFEDILTVNGGKPYDEKEYFNFMRGDILQEGQVFTLRCVRKDCYAKMQIMSVTVVPKTDGK